MMLQKVNSSLRHLWRWAPQAMVIFRPFFCCNELTSWMCHKRLKLSQAVPATPRTSPTTRQHDIEPDDHESKRAMVEASKKQRFDRISADYASMVRSVKFSNDEHFHNG